MAKKGKSKRGKKQLSAKQKGLYRFHGLGDYTDGTEYKFFDSTVNIVSSVQNEPHILTPLANLAQNSTAQGRDGLKIWVKSISVKMLMKKPQENGSDVSIPVTRWDYRLFVDRNTNGTPVTVSDYQDTPTARPNGGLSVFIPKLANAARFTTLKTGNKKSLMAYSDPDNFGQIVHDEFFLRFPGKGMEVIINNTDGGITGFRSNNLYLLLQNSDVANFPHDYHVYSRIRFTD